MFCTNCYKKIDDNLKVCPHCNAPIDKTVMRCPSCWNKLAADSDVCDKCGCKIKEFLMEKEEILKYREPTLKDKIKALSLKTKIIILSAIIIVVTAACVFGAVSYINQREELRLLSAEYTLFTDDSVRQITNLAEHYENDVYNKDWITYIEAAQELRQKYKDDILSIKKFRETLSHRRNKIRATGDKKAGELADEIYYCYSNCYGYVVGETGKYPNYLEKYRNLVDKYNNAVDELMEYVK